MNPAPRPAETTALVDVSESSSARPTRQPRFARPQPARTQPRSKLLTSILRRRVGELVVECGSHRQAAFRLGVDRSAVTRWLLSDRVMSGPTIDLLVERLGRKAIGEELRR